ncbi:MAG: CHASE domain-containing protein [Nitrospirae bacterium]|nr:CHASE domain-containing protein [Nitrospirota bacterium]
MLGSSRINSLKAIAVHRGWFFIAPGHSWVAWVVLSVCLAVTVAATLYVKWDKDASTRREFALIGDEVKAKILGRLEIQEHILTSGVALFNTYGAVTRQQWHTFVSSLNVQRKFPGIQGIGFALLIPKDKLNEHIMEIRREGFPQYQVRPEGKREIYSSIIYIEPFSDRNLRAFGYDMFSEPVRRAAMQEARDRNAAALSDRVTLVQEHDKDVQAGALMYIPVYRINMPIDTIRQRRDAIFGWVYSPYRINDLMNGILGSWSLHEGKAIRLRIFDGTLLSPSTLLYDSRQPGQGDANTSPRFSLNTPIDFNGHIWTLKFDMTGGKEAADGPATVRNGFAPATVRNGFDYDEIWIVLSSGITISLLMFILTRYHLLTIRFKDDQILQHKLMEEKLRTSEKDLSEVRNNLQVANEELEMKVQDRTRELRQEVSERIKTEEDMARLNRIYSVVSSTTHLIVHAKDRDALFKGICRIAVEQGRLSFAWVGMLDKERKKIIPVESFGLDRAFITEFHNLDVSTSNTPLYHVVTTGEILVCNNIQEEDRYEIPWRQERPGAGKNQERPGVEKSNDSLWRGLMSMAKFPIIISNSLLTVAGSNSPLTVAGSNSSLTTAGSGKIEGVIGFYASEVDFFSDEETKLLYNLSSDISYALEVMKNEEMHKDADALNKKLSSVVEQSPSIVLITDIEGNIQYANRKFTEVTGYTAEEVIGQNPRIWKSDQTNPDEHKRLWSTIKTGRQWSSELCNKKKSGETYWEHATIFPLINREGETINYLKIAEDLTVKRGLEEQLRQSQKMEAIGQLTGGIAHDFNNILFAITNYVYLLQKKIGDDITLKKYVDNIQFATDKASDLTKSLLAFSRKQIIQPKSIDLNVVISNMEKLMRRLIPTEIELHTRLTEKAFAIMADPVQIEQILVNLVTNARDAMPEGGLISIQTDVVEIDKTYFTPKEFIDAGVYAVLIVADTGTGITEEVRKKMFDPFFTTKELGKGTGLGLSTVFGIVSQNNGRIHVYSDPGYGATFKIFLPVIASLDKSQVEEETTKPTGGSETILVMEDDTAIITVMREILEGAGYRMIGAIDGVEGVEKYNKYNLTMSYFIPYHIWRYNCQVFSSDFL